MKSTYVKYFFLLVITSLVFLFSCEKKAAIDPHTPPGQGPVDSTITPFPVKQVDILFTGFTPATLSINKGASVNWTNKDSAEHTASGPSGSFDSGHLGRGANFLYTFRDTGTFYYFCRYHKEGGVISVK